MARENQVKRTDREVVVDGEISLIELTRGMWAGVDSCDVELLNQYSWCSFWNGSLWYAVTTIGRKNVYMHRLLMGATDPKVHVDHKNRETLDNRKSSNLRLATVSQNRANSRARSMITTHFKGVHWNKGKKKWDAAITIGGVRKRLGRFNTAEEGAAAYDKAAQLYFGEFSLTNSQLAA